MQEKPSKVLRYIQRFNETIEAPVLPHLASKFPILNYKAPFEDSGYSTIENILRGFIRPFILGYGFKAFINLLLALLKFKKWTKNPLILLKAFARKDNLKLAMLLSTFTSVMKVVIALSRIARNKDDGYNGFLGGLIAGWLSLFFTAKDGRAFLACFMMSRAFDCYYNHLVINKTITKKEWHFPMIFALCGTVTGYAYGHEQYLNSPSVNKAFDQMSTIDGNNLSLMWLWHEITRRRLVRQGILSEPYLLPIKND